MGLQRTGPTCTSMHFLLTEGRTVATVGQGGVASLLECAPPLPNFPASARSRKAVERVGRFYPQATLLTRG